MNKFEGGHTFKKNGYPDDFIKAVEKEFPEDDFNIRHWLANNDGYVGQILEKAMTAQDYKISVPCETITKMIDEGKITELREIAARKSRIGGLLTRWRLIFFGFDAP